MDPCSVEFISITGNPARQFAFKNTCAISLFHMCTITVAGSGCCTYARIASGASVRRSQREQLMRPRILVTQPLNSEEKGGRERRVSILFREILNKCESKCHFLKFCRLFVIKLSRNFIKILLINFSEILFNCFRRKMLTIVTNYFYNIFSNQNQI
jgi:hypothetical protein